MEVSRQNQIALAESAAPQAKERFFAEHRHQLVALLFLTELLTPILIWKVNLPGATDFISEAIALGMTLLTFGYMLLHDYFPKAIFLILAVTLIWVIVAAFEGQSPAATAWGWWKFFKYPMVGLYVYVITRWSAGFAPWLLKFLVALMGIEVVVQIIQYLTGQPTGDSLAGTFGRFGVGPYSMFIFFAVSISLGYWLATRKWQMALAVVSLGMAATIMSGTKAYLVFVGVLLLAMIVIHMIRGGQFRQLFLYTLGVIVLVAVFVPVYNRVVTNWLGLKTLNEYLEPEAVRNYIFYDGGGDVDGRYNLGRGLAVSYGWQTLQRDVTTTLFGMGLGNRSSSSFLGIAGKGLEGDLYGGVGGTSMLTIMQEIGLVGLGGLLLFFGWVSARLFRYARRNPDPYLAALQYGLLIFTLFWPLWLFYHKTWAFSVVNVLYWGILGYVFQQMYRTRALNREEARRAGPGSF